MAAKATMTMERAREIFAKAVTRQISGDRKSDGLDKIIRDYARDVRNVVLEEVGKIYGFEMKWGEFEVKQGTLAYAQIYMLLQEETKGMFEDFRPQVREIIATQLEKMKPKISKFFKEAVDEELYKLSRSYLHDQVSAEISRQIQQMVAEWAEKNAPDLLPSDADHGGGQ